MPLYGVSNQLIQIDTGKVRTQFWNQALSPIAVYSAIGEIQVPGQRYFSVVNQTPSNPNGSQAVYMLVNYKSTGNPAPQIGPAPVYWTDTNFTTVTGVASEGFATQNSLAGYMMINTTDAPSITAAQINGAQLFIQVAGLLTGALATTATTGGAAVAGSKIIGANANWGADTVAAGTAPGYTIFGTAASAVVGGLFNIVLQCDYTI